MKVGRCIVTAVVLATAVASAQLRPPALSPVTCLGRACRQEPGRLSAPESPKRLGRPFPAPPAPARVKRTPIVRVAVVSPRASRFSQRLHTAVENQRPQGDRGRAVPGLAR